jgi:hypothetical protein
MKIREQLGNNGVFAFRRSLAIDHFSNCAIRSATGPSRLSMPAPFDGRGVELTLDNTNLQVRESRPLISMEECLTASQKPPESTGHSLQCI